MICYGAAIQACGDAGLTEEALSLMEKMSREGILPDKTAYNSAIIAVSICRTWGRMRIHSLSPIPSHVFCCPQETFTAVENFILSIWGRFYLPNLMLWFFVL